MFDPKQLKRLAEIRAEKEKLDAEETTIKEIAMQSIGDAGFSFIDKKLGKVYKMIKVTTTKWLLKKGITPEKVQKIAPDAVKENISVKSDYLEELKDLFPDAIEVTLVADTKLMEQMEKCHDLLEPKESSYIKFSEKDAE